MNPKKILKRGTGVKEGITTTGGAKDMAEIFDRWPEQYDQWFETPLGRLIKTYEAELILSMLNPGRGEFILDAGCGTGVFTADILEAGARVAGAELSRPMLLRAVFKYKGKPFLSVQGDMRRLPFSDGSFDKAVSVTAVEFIENAKAAVEEMFRVTKPGGTIVVATLNSLSPWARRRTHAGKQGHPVFRHAVFRSPEAMAGLSPVKGVVQTAVHFEKDHDLNLAQEIEKEGRQRRLNTGAFLAARWIKPG
jgi:ubiquinone/menaquinone biosynthesis C-methylase UbiE